MSPRNAALAGLVDVVRAAPDDVARGGGQVAAWARTRLVADPPRAVLALLRRRRPVLKVGSFTLLTRRADVTDVLTRADRFRVTHYANVMRDLVGDFALAADGDEHTRLRARLEPVLAQACDALDEWADVVAPRLLSEAFDAQALDPVAELAVRLPTLFAIDRGLVPPHPDDPDGDRLAAAATDVYEACFGNLAGDRGVERRGRAAADELMARGLDADHIGLVVGAIPTVAEALPRAVTELRARPSRWSEVRGAADRGDRDVVWAYVREALRFSPQAPGLVRADVADPAGVVLASTYSAMHDPARVSCPSAFRTDRPDDTYLHFGAGPHRCLGEPVAQALLVAAVTAVALADAVEMH